MAPVLGQGPPPGGPAGWSGGRHMAAVLLVAVLGQGPPPGEPPGCSGGRLDRAWVPTGVRVPRWSWVLGWSWVPGSARVPGSSWAGVRGSPWPWACGWPDGWDPLVTSGWAAGRGNGRDPGRVGDGPVPGRVVVPGRVGALAGRERGPGWVLVPVGRRGCGAVPGRAGGFVTGRAGGVVTGWAGGAVTGRPAAR